MINIDKLCFNYTKERSLLSDLSFTLSKGCILGIAGPNGAGKSTLLKLLLNIFTPTSGQVLLNKKPLNSYTHKEIAKQIAWIGPTPPSPFNFTVTQVVNMGHYPHNKTFLDQFKATNKSNSKTNDALELTDLTHLKNRYIHQLSSGEQQRVFLARAFVQNPKLLLLDEAVSHLDLKHQSQIKDILLKKNKEDDLAIVMVSHHLNFLSHFAKELLLLNDGKIMTYGPTKEVMTEENLKMLYGDSVQIAKGTSAYPLVYI